MSTYLKMTPAATDDYAVYPEAVAVAPETATKEEPRPVRRAKRPEFYKPFHYLLLVYLFFYCSRIPEMIPFLHVGLLLQPILLAGMIMTGTTKTIFKTDIGKIMTAFTAWVTFCVPFSVWKWGSFNTWQLAVQALLLMFFMAAFIRTLDDCYRVMYTIALGITAIGVLSLLIGGGQHNDASRLALGSKNDTLADANFLALYLVVGIPFLYFAATWKRGIVRIGLILLVLPLLASLGRTGSRMGLLALGAGLLFFLIFATVPQRVFIVLAGVLCIGLAPFLLPQKIMERFTTFFSAHTAAGEEAAESAAARETMLKRGIQMTMEHPIVGVGPGEFIDAEAKEAAAQGHRGLWRYTHNAYTELSSETGLIGLALFVFAMFRSYRGLSRYRSRFPSARVRRAALCIQIAVLISAIGAFFLSIAYSGILYAIMGIAAAFQLAASKEFKALKAQA
jgi:O-antigen ligase